MPGCVRCTPGPRPPQRCGRAGVAGWWLFPAAPVRRSLPAGVVGRPCGDRVSFSHRRVRWGLSTGGCVGGDSGGTGWHPAVPIGIGRGGMRRITTSRERLREAVGLPAVLDAAFCAFEDMLAAIEGLADPGDGMFIPLVMAAAATADGRDAIGFAPSLPPRRLHPAAVTEGPEPAESV